MTIPISAFGMRDATKWVIVATTWVIVSPQGLHYVGIHASALDAWVVGLGGADIAEIESHQAAGWYASPATLNWIKPKESTCPATTKK